MTATLPELLAAAIMNVIITPAIFAHHVLTTTIVTHNLFLVPVPMSAPILIPAVNAHLADIIQIVMFPAWTAEYGDVANKTLAEDAWHVVTVTGQAHNAEKMLPTQAQK